MTTMPTRVLPPRRSCLAVPGSSDKMLRKAQGLPADEVFLDLEDAVAGAAPPPPAPPPRRAGAAPRRGPAARSSRLSCTATGRGRTGSCA